MFLELVLEVIILSTFTALTSQLNSNCSIPCSWLQPSLTTLCLGVDCLPTFSQDTERLFIADSTLPEIPANSFSDLANLSAIHIYDSKIGTLKSHSFNSTRNIEDVYIHHVTLDRIEKYAFERSTFAMGGKFNVYEVKIGTIEAMAFFKIRDMESFTFFAANITTIESKAFYKISTSKSFHMYQSIITNLHSLALDGFTDMKNVVFFSCYIENLRRNTLDAFKSDIGSEFFVYYITIDCGCKMSWLLDAREHMLTSFVLDGITCSNGRRTVPAARGLVLSNLSLTDICPVRDDMRDLTSSMKFSGLEKTTVPLERNSTRNGATHANPADLAHAATYLLLTCLILYSV